MANIGYARVSTREQKLEIQMEHLHNYGCDKIFADKLSGKNTDRAQLQAAMDYMREGDNLVVYKIDRLARSILDLHSIVKALHDRGIGVIFIKEQIDFSKATGRLMFNMLGSIAEFERELIQERAAEGRAAAREAGKHMGRPMRPKKDIQRAVDLFYSRGENGLSVADISKMTQVPQRSIYTYAKDPRYADQRTED
ncbi:recombinase family protein [Bacillus cereus group sp. BfR-BA-01518]|uniref:recombinase family protein n=1 Tax=Bacillus cereus group sp. BfR-BA-01518 TaxID=2920368 RepID=UPI001F55E43A|nr:recombinase family protein [Bacillus cereus group sp. BfR-BA-01518]